LKKFLDVEIHVKCADIPQKYFYGTTQPVNTKPIMPWNILINQFVIICYAIGRMPYNLLTLLHIIIALNFKQILCTCDVQGRILGVCVQAEKSSR
jgi:hypothetical protein